MPQQKCLAVFVLSYSGEWVGPDGQDNPSVDIYRYLSKVAARVLQWAKAHPESEVFVVCNGGIGIAGRPEAEVLSKFARGRPPATWRLAIERWPTGALDRTDQCHCSRIPRSGTSLSPVRVPTPSRPESLRAICSPVESLRWCTTPWAVMVGSFA